MDYLDGIEATVKEHKERLNALYEDFLNECKEWRLENRDILEEMDRFEGVLNIYDDDVILEVVYNDGLNYFEVHEVYHD